MRGALTIVIQEVIISKRKGGAATATLLRLVMTCGYLGMLGQMATGLRTDLNEIEVQCEGPAESPVVVP